MILVAVILLLQNSYSTPIKFLFLKVQLPQSVLILIVLLIGMIFGFWIDKKRGQDKNSDG